MRYTVCGDHPAREAQADDRVDPRPDYIIYDFKCVCVCVRARAHVCLHKSVPTGMTGWDENDKKDDYVPALAVGWIESDRYVQYYFDIFWIGCAVCG